MLHAGRTKSVQKIKLGFLMVGHTPRRRRPVLLTFFKAPGMESCKDCSFING